MVANSGSSLKLRERSFLTAIIKMLTLRQEYSKKVNASFKGLNQCSPSNGWNGRSAWKASGSSAFKHWGCIATWHFKLLFGKVVAKNCLVICYCSVGFLFLDSRFALKLENAVSEKCSFGYDSLMNDRDRKESSSLRFRFLPQPHDVVHVRSLLVRVCLCLCRGPLWVMIVCYCLSLSGQLPRNSADWGGL